MEVYISGLKLPEPVEGQLKITTKMTNFKQDTEEVLKELHTIKQEVDLMPDDSVCKSLKFEPVENRVVEENFKINPQCEPLKDEIPFNEEDIKQETIELGEYELNLAKHDCVDEGQTVNSSTVESQDGKELVIRLEKLDHSTLVKPISKPRRVCEHCGRTFSYEYRLAQHRVKEHGSTETPIQTRSPPKKSFPRNFHCDQCGKSYHHQTKLATHKAKVHRVGEATPRGRASAFKHICKHCGKQIQTWFALVYHLKHIHGQTVDETQLVRCTTCRARFTSAEELSQHVCFRKSVYENIHRFKCDLCDKAYATKKGLYGHFSVHPEYQHYKCDQCPMKFFNMSELNKHNRMKHKPKESLIECETCGNQFQTLDGWTRHQEGHARGGEQFCCEHCGKKFKIHAHFRAHKYHVHAEHVSELVREVLHIPCTICGRVFKGKQSYGQHMQGHNNVGRFKCTFAQCKKSFITNHSLKVHEQSHTKDYKFKCKFCDYGTVVRKRLLLHEQQEHEDEFTNDSG